MRSFANSHVKVLASNHNALDLGYQLVEHLERLNDVSRRHEPNFWRDGYITIEVENHNVYIRSTPRDYPADIRLYFDMSSVKHLYTVDDRIVIGIEFAGCEYAITIDGCFIILPATSEQSHVQAAD